MTDIQISEYSDYKNHLKGGNLKHLLTVEMARLTIARMAKENRPAWVINWTKDLLNERIQEAHEEVL